MKKLLNLAFVVVVIFGLFSLAVADERIRLSTTTSTENSGLLHVLLPPFEKAFNTRVNVISVGTGKALKLAENGDVDVTLVHARSLEDKFLRDGHGVNRRDVMYNDFVIIGPESDDANVGTAKTAAEAFKRILMKEATFISRGDNSGTHVKEMSIWKISNMNPSGSWYLEAGKGMGAVLMIAGEKRAYTLTDQGTYLAFLQKDKIDLPILFHGDPPLFNPYGIIVVNPSKHRHVNYVKAMALIGWMTSRQGQKIIKEFGKQKFGKPLFTPVAVPNP